MSALKNILYDALNLDIIIEVAIVNSVKTMPDFTTVCEKRIMTELLDYTQNIIRRCNTESEGVNAETVIENQADGLLDAVSDAEHAYIKNGMRLGAHLLLQLLIMY